MSEASQGSTWVAADPPFWRQEDWWANGIGIGLLLMSLGLVSVASAPGEKAGAKVPHPLAWTQAKFHTWSNQPSSAFPLSSQSLVALAASFVGITAVSGLAAAALGITIRRFLPAMAITFLLAGFSFVLAEQELIKASNLEYVLWALLVGMLISNTIGTPTWLRSSIRSEFFIKTGLVLLGAEIVFGRLMQLGGRGIAVSWVVTPIVLVTTYWIGQRLLRIRSRSLNLVISADMSVCGVSAAIATAAACKASKRELSLAIGMSLLFTVFMMLLLPYVAIWLQLGPEVAGAWIGGTIDSTGAVTVAGKMLGERAMDTAVTVKMIQNILIGVIAFAVSIYWTTWIEPTSEGRLSIWEIWRRFPKFVLGFVLASVLVSMLVSLAPMGREAVDASTSMTKYWRTWFFCLAFVAIGLETNFRELFGTLEGGRPVALYLIGQSINLLLTLGMAQYAFGDLAQGDGP